MIQNITFAIILLAALFLFILACLSFFTPKHAIRFLSSFASSAKTHYLEMFFRLIVGTAFIINAHGMLYPKAFLIFGWMIVGSTIILLLLPWRWHNFFGKKFASPVIYHIWLIGIGSLILSIFIFFATLMGTNII